MAAASAVVVSLALVVTPISDRSTAPVASPVVSHVAVQIRDATQLPGQGSELSVLSTLSTAQVLDIGRALSASAVTPTIAPSAPLINLANFIDWAYLAIEPWVRYAVDVAAYVAAWIIPYVGWIVINQVDVVYNFVESLVHSGVFNTTDWLRGEGSALKNIADWIVDLGLATVWLGIDEIGAWIPLPPLPFYPPRPPYADVPEGLFGDVLVATSHALAQVSNGIWNVWEPIKGGIDRGVGSISSILDAFAFVPFLPLINFELNEGWTLIAAEGDAITGFAHDLINAGDQFVVDAVHGDGLVAATITALNTTLDSIGLRGGQAIGAFVDWGRAQLDYFVDLVTPGAAAMASTVRQATATDSSLEAPAVRENTSTVAKDAVSPNGEPPVGITSTETDTADDNTIGADSHPAPPKSATDTPVKDTDSSDAEPPKTKRPAVEDVDNDDAGKAGQKTEADAQKPTHKPGADAGASGKKTGPKDGGK